MKNNGNFEETLTNLETPWKTLNIFSHTDASPCSSSLQACEPSPLKSKSSDGEGNVIYNTVGGQQKW